MRVAVDDAVIVERHVPGPEHPQRDLVAIRQRCLFRNIEDRRPVEPGHRQQPAGREVGERSGTSTPGSPRRISPIEPHMCGLALVIELLAQPVGDFGMDLASRDRAVVPLVDAHRQLQLPQVGLHRRCHFGVLQLTGERPAVERRRPVHLAERCRPCRGLLEIAKLRSASRCRARPPSAF